MSDWAGMLAWLSDALNTIAAAAEEVSEEEREWVARSGDFFADQVWADPPDGLLPVAIHVTASNHVTRNDPRAVLARVEASRAILEVHKPWNDGRTATFCSEFEHDEQEWPCPTVLWLAYGHRFDIPGYAPSWAPKGVNEP